MPEHMWRYLYFFLVRQPAIRLGRHALDDRGCFTAGEASAGARDKEGRGLILARLQPVIEDLTRVPMHGHKIPDPATLDLHPFKALAGVLVPVQPQRFRYAQARAEQYGEQCMVGPVRTKL